MFKTFKFLSSCFKKLFVKKNWAETWIEKGISVNTEYTSNPPRQT